MPIFKALLPKDQFKSNLVEIYLYNIEISSYDESIYILRNNVVQV